MKMKSIANEGLGLYCLSNSIH